MIIRPMLVTCLVSLFLWLGVARQLQPPTGSHASQVLLPIEVMGDAGIIVERELNIPGNRYKSVRSLWLEVHGVHYPEQASVRINHSDWVPLRNETTLIGEPGRSFGGLGGGFWPFVAVCGGSLICL